MSILKYLKSKYWKTKSILKDIKKAKQIYINNRQVYMCLTFLAVDPWRYVDGISKVIPEFKPQTFGLEQMLTRGPWWPRSDKQSRLGAYDKLIEIYTNKLKQF